MDFGKRLKSLVSRNAGTGGGAPVLTISPIIPDYVEEKGDTNKSPPRRDPSRHSLGDCMSRNAAGRDPFLEDAVMDTIEAVYFSEDPFDSSKHELDKLPADISPEIVSVNRAILQKQLSIVSRKVSDLIIKNKSSYAVELEHVMELQRRLNDAIDQCVKSRELLSTTKRDFTTASLGILANCRKRNLLIRLLRLLKYVKTLQQTGMRLQVLLKDEDYPGAIQLCLACRSEIGDFEHYKCTQELRSKLDDTLQMTEQRLDDALARVCTEFDVNLYSKLQVAYGYLGKTQVAIDQLLMHYASAVHNGAFSVVANHCMTTESTSNVQKRQYTELCVNVPIDQYILCLVNLSSTLWRIICSYKEVIQWHIDHPLESENADENDYIKQKLDHGKLRIWSDIQQKVKGLLAADLSSFEFQQFIQVLDVIKHLVMLGEEFSGTQSDVLETSVKSQSSRYLESYHRHCFDELRIFLENETWTLVPVRENFSPLNLPEFSFLRRRQMQQRSPTKAGLKSPPPPGEKKKDVCPFQALIESPDDEDEFMDSARCVDDTDSEDEDIPEELKRDYVEEDGREHLPKPVKRRKHVFYLTNATLNVLRLFGKYTRMMDVLRPISADILEKLMHIYDYYLYFIYASFGSNAVLQSASSTIVQRVMREVREIPHQTHPIIENFESLHGLSERTVAVESLVYLSEQLVLLRPDMESMISASRKPVLMQHVQQASAAAAELRRPVFGFVSEKAINYDLILQQMSTVQWSVSDLQSQHSPYVDTAIRQLQVFISRLSQAEHTIPLPAHVVSLLLEHAVRMLNRTFVKGFSRVQQPKDCSHAGRALMLLDFQQFMSKVEKLVEVRPLPDRKLVEEYIRAFYMTAQDLSQWISAHFNEYSAQQLTNLVSCMSQLNKRDKASLIQAIEEQSRNSSINNGLSSSSRVSNNNFDD